jgi:hypothetical protein
MMLYAQLIADRARAHVNARLDRLWRLGGFVLNVRDAVVRIGEVTGRLAAVSAGGRQVTLTAEPEDIGFGLHRGDKLIARDTRTGAEHEFVVALNQ